MSKMQNPNFMVIVPQFQTQPNTVSYRDRLGYVRDLPVISLYHMGFPKIGGTQIESCETYGLGVLSCHGFPHIPIAYCSPGHSQHQWQLRFQGAVQRCTRWSARFDRWSLACRWETTDGDMFSPSSSPVWPLKNVNQIQTMKWWSCSKMFYMFFRRSSLEIRLIRVTWPWERDAWRNSRHAVLALLAETGAPSENWLGGRESPPARGVGHLFVRK